MAAFYRLFVYASGFLVVIALSKLLPSQSFGEYAIYQSIIEFGVVVGTMGSAFFFSRRSAGAPVVSRSDLHITLLISVPSALVFCSGLVAVQNIHQDIAISFIVGSTILSLSGCLLLLALARGDGRHLLLNVEPGIRSTVLLVALVAMGSGPALRDIFLVNLSASLFILLLLILGKQALVLPIGASRLSLRERGLALSYGLQAFLVRKGDVLLFGAVMPPAFVGHFKLAFLFAEAPSQFVQAYLSGQFSNLSSAATLRFDDIHYQIQKRVLFGSTFLMASAAFALIMVSHLLNWSEDVGSLFLVLSGYFFVRSYTSYHDVLLQLNDSVRTLWLRTLFELLVRLVGYAGAWLLLRRVEFAFFLFAIVELGIYEWRLKRLFGQSPTMFFVRRSLGRAYT